MDIEAALKRNQEERIALMAAAVRVSRASEKFSNLKARVKRLSAEADEMLALLKRAKEVG